ncbi:MAG TPA: hypothetical protein ENK82_05180 [Campylobacterales bacterium]|nr:hypothetical protein [Campylobacterales bacterium]HHS92718.1 hypothetical protein [Campylobacterales bacterium]
MKKKLLLAIFIIILGALTSYFLSGSLLIYALTLVLATIILYFAKVNNANRKENLNIIRDENKLYFYLSDDLLFSVNLRKGQSIKDILRESIHQEMSTIKKITRKICFINFTDDALLKELNRSLKLSNPNNRI